MRLLIADDDDRRAQWLAVALSERGFTADICGLGSEALLQAAQVRYSAILLDGRLRDLSSVEICSTLRRRGDTVPVILLGGGASLAEKIEAFEGGADDILIEPYAMEELVARARALIRRRGATRSPDYRFGAVSFVDIGRIVQIGSARFELTVREFALFLLLVEGGGATISRAQILESVWRSADAPESNFIEVHLVRLRIKLGYFAGCVQTIRGMGYRFIHPTDTHLAMCDAHESSRPVRSVEAPPRARAS